MLNLKDTTILTPVWICPGPPRRLSAKAAILVPWQSGNRLVTDESADLHPAINKFEISHFWRL
jgi:hypothetical protein